MTPSTIMTRYGEFDLLRIQDSEFDIRDIAHALSHTCRFRGFTTRLYSVAQHSYNVSVLLQSQDVSPRIQLAGLMHDAAEAYLGDMPTPFKRSFRDFAEIEAYLQSAICDQFGIPWPLHELVHWADDVMLHVEARLLVEGQTWARYEPTPRDVDMTPWSCDMAKRLFLVRFRALTGLIGDNSA